MCANDRVYIILSDDSEMKLFVSEMSIFGHNFLRSLEFNFAFNISRDQAI